MLAALWAVGGIGALAAEAVPDPPPAQMDPYVRRPLIQTFTPKRYLKMNHIEVMPAAGLVLGDPFVRRLLVGATVAWHLSEVAALSTTWQFSPNLGEVDWTWTTDDMVRSKLAVPALSRIVGVATADLQFSPLYGKVAMGNQIVRFDLYGTVGMGALRTEDDLNLIDIADLPSAQATRSQWHPDLGIGGGLRTWLGTRSTGRIEIRSHSYVEVIDGTQLTMKNVAALTAGVSWLMCGARDQEDCVPHPPSRAGRH